MSKEVAPLTSFLKKSKTSKVKAKQKQRRINKNKHVNLFLNTSHIRFS